ncbi:MAG: PUA domain-containing protein [Candidatus Hodarchaeota archaeon]
MKYTHHCVTTSALEKRLRFLNDVSENGLNAFLNAISRPSSCFYLRINTIKQEPRAFLEIMRNNHPDLNLDLDPRVPEALKLDVSGPIDIEESPKKLEVDKFAAESIMMSAPLYAPGFKTVMKRFKKGDLVSMYHHYRKPGTREDASFLCGNGVALFDSNQMHELDKGEIVRTTDSWFFTPRIQDWNEFKQGILLDQNLPSMVASIVLNPRAGEHVLDVCAGSGGKTTHLAQLMENKGIVKAVDRNARKIALMGERVEKMSISCVNPIQSKIKHMEKCLEDFHPKKVMIDPPCSALGLRPKLYIDHDEKILDNFRANQERIWRHVAPFLEPGTQCLYCTCTILPEENEGVVATAMDEHDLKLVEPSLKLGHPGLDWDTLSRNELKKLIRFYPQLDDQVGFFIAMLEKN